MTEKEAVRLILKTVNSNPVPSVVGLGESGLSRVKDLFQRDANKAVGDFMQNRDPGPLVEVAASLHAYGKISGEQYDQLQKAFEKE